MTSKPYEKACGYVRVSSHTNVGRGSEPRQREDISTFAGKHGFRVERFFMDLGVSGERHLDDRPEFLAMLEYMEATKIKTVIVPDMTRFIRKYDVYAEAMEVLSKSGISIIFAEDEEDLIEAGVSEEKRREIMAKRAERDKQKLVEQLRDGREHKKETDVSRYVGRLRKEEQDREVGGIVLRCHRSGMSLSQISGELAAAGKLTASKRPWDKKQVQRVLNRLLN